MAGRRTFIFTALMLLCLPAVSTARLGRGRYEFGPWSSGFALRDPGADRLVMWDDSESSIVWLSTAAWSPTFAGLTITSCAVFGANSAVFQPATDSTTFGQWLDADGGTPIFNVDSTNERVGIGTASPATKLSVFQEADNSGLRIYGYDDFSAVYGSMYIDSSGRLNFDTYGPYHIYFRRNGTLEMYIDSNGCALNDNATYSLGGYSNAQLKWRKANNKGALNIGVEVGTVHGADTSTGHVSIMEKADISQANRQAASAASDPTLRVYSADATQVDDYIEFTHDQADAIVSWGNGLCEFLHTSPYLAFHNSTHEDTDGGGESRIIGKREDGAGTETAAGQIEICHDGSGANDQLGRIVASVNTGAGLVEALRINSKKAVSTPLGTKTLGVGDTTFVISGNVMTITGDGGANTIATITGANSGTLLTLIFVDALVTITDDNTHAANSVDLSAAFTSADDTTLQLVFNGTSWYEVSRSVN